VDILYLASCFSPRALYSRGHKIIIIMLIFSPLRMKYQWAIMIIIRFIKRRLSVALKSFDTLDTRTHTHVQTGPKTIFICYYDITHKVQHEKIDKNVKNNKAEYQYTPFITRHQYLQLRTL